MTPTPFAIVGAGWRAAFFLRVAGALPERFRVTGVLTRDATRRTAVATCLAGVADWLEGGPDVCSLADAAQDHYIGLCIDEAATGRPVTTTGHVWG